VLRRNRIKKIPLHNVKSLHDDQIWHQRNTTTNMQVRLKFNFYVFIGFEEYIFCDVIPCGPVEVHQSFEGISVNQWTTLHHIPEQSTLHSQCCENFKSNFIRFVHCANSNKWPVQINWFHHQLHGLGHAWSIRSSWRVCWSLHLNCGHPIYHLIVLYVKILEPIFHS
jgi:hypothetical protein